MSVSRRKTTSKSLSINKGKGILSKLKALNESAWNLKNQDANQALQMSLEAKRLAEQADDKQQFAHALCTSGACYFLLGEHESAINDSSQAYRIFEELGDSAGAANALNCLGNVADRVGDYPGSIDYHLRSLRLRESLNDRQGQAYSLNNLGVAYYHLGDYGTALDYYLKSFKIKEELQIQPDLAPTFSNLGAVYEKLGEYEKALQYYLKTISITELYQNKQNVGMFLNNVGGAYELLGDHEQALTYLFRGLNSARQFHDKRGEAASLYDIGNVHLRIGDYDQAKDYFNSSLKILEDVQFVHLRTQVLIKLGTVMLKQGDKDSALDSLSNALALATESNLKELIYQAHEMLSQTYEAKNNLANALAHFKAFFQAREMVLGEESDKKIQSVIIQAEIQKAEQETEIYRLKNVELARAYELLQKADEEKTILLEQLRKQSALLERQSREDALTGLANRRHFDEQFQSEFTRIRRFNRELAVVMADIDHFKRINDSFSHQVGDEVLKTVAAILRKNTRSTDIVARYGGEEFVLLLVETAKQDAVYVCEKIRREVEEYSWTALHPKMQVTISMGIANYDRGSKKTELLQKADEKLYEAKTGGRNQVRA